MSKRVAIIGCGLIGRGWATAFARAGWSTRLWDRDADAAASACAFVRRALEDLHAAKLCAAPRSLPVPEPCTTLVSALDGVDYAQECLPENKETKTAIFAELDEAAPGSALLGSSTSTLPGSDFLAALAGQNRAMVAHPANPPHLMPVVELVPSAWHNASDIEGFKNLMRDIGQVPVVLHKEVQGFVMNRLQTAVVNEAISLVSQGVVDPDDLDAVMKHSLGLRWALMGPFETMDLNAPDGFLDYASRYGHLYQEMGKTLRVADPWPPDALEKIEAARRRATPREEVAAKMQQRDVALMRVLAARGKEGRP